MKQESAVEWMARHLRAQNSPYTKEQIIEIASEMEKEQIVTAYYQGYRNDIDTTEVAEKYYNETFK